MSAPAPAPFFTVVIPTFDRPRALEACLRALVAQELPRDHFEVVVVDDGSSASPDRVVERFRTTLAIRLIEQPSAGPGAARNRGAWAARGQYLAFTDDDCLPDPGWLSALAARIAEHPRVAVGGQVVNALGNGIYSTASQLLIEFLYRYYNADATGGRFFITSNLAVPVAAFRELGGFDASFPLAAAEDRDLCDRWRERGYEMVYAESAVVRHAHALTLVSFCQQHFNYGRGANHLHLARSRRGKGKLRIEPLRFYSALVWYPLSTAVSARNGALSLLALLSQVAYASGYLLERVAGRRSQPHAAMASPEGGS